MTKPIDFKVHADGIPEPIRKGGTSTFYHKDQTYHSAPCRKRLFWEFYRAAEMWLYTNSNQ